MRTNGRRSGLARAGFLALAAVIVFTAGLLPSCGAGCCPLAPKIPMVDMEMACCQTTFSPSDAARRQPATAGSTVDSHIPAAVIVRLHTDDSRPRAGHPRGAIASVPVERSSPLFLLNAQLLI